MTVQEKKQPSTAEELIFLVAKILIAAVLCAVLFLFVFGIHRCGDNSMAPAVKHGDLAFYYRLQQDYRSSDVVVLEKDNQLQVRRIVAQAGDIVEIGEDGLRVNGYLQQESGIFTETLPYTEGISFPVTLGKDEYFVLGDNRLDAKDSRIYGAVRKEEIKGLLITLLRRRNF